MKINFLYFLLGFILVITTFNVIKSHNFKNGTAIQLKLFTNPDPQRCTDGRGVPELNALSVTALSVNNLTVAGLPQLLAISTGCLNSKSPLGEHDFHRISPYFCCFGVFNFQFNPPLITNATGVIQGDSL